MHKFTQHVIVAARQQRGELSQIQQSAAWTLIQYFSLARGWPPDSPAWTDASVREWWDLASSSMYRKVQEAWDHPGMRAHISQLAELYELSWKLYPSADRDQERREFLVSICNDLGVWKAWPGLHDVRVLLPLPTAFARNLRKMGPAGPGSH